MNFVSHTSYLTVTTPQRYEIRDITEEVERVRREARLADGTILVSTMHITSSIFVNDHEPGLVIVHKDARGDVHRAHEDRAVR